MTDKNNNMSSRRRKNTNNSRLNVTQQYDTTMDTTAAMSFNVSRAGGGAKRRKVELTPIQSCKPGTLFAFGRGEMGQLGLGPEILKRNYPTLVDEIKDKKVIQVVAGGIHTVVLEEGGKVWTFGCNDDYVLGRTTKEEEDNFIPGQVNLGDKRIVQVSAGDAHTAALTDDGDVYAWGTFRNENGVFGFIPGTDNKYCEKPELISASIGLKVFKIASGDNHIVMLTEEGSVFTCGTGEQGQLGRVRRATRASASERDFLLTPSKVRMTRKVNDIWAGNFATYMATTDKTEIFVCGLNNFNQLGITDNDVIQQPLKSPGFQEMHKKWDHIAAGQHHAVVLDNDGKVYCIGKVADGRLGLGDDVEGTDGAVNLPTLVPLLQNKKCVQVSAGLAESYAVTEDGKLYAWGSGVNFQLGNGSEEDLTEPEKLNHMVIGKSKQPLTAPTNFVSGGGQHVAVILDSVADENKMDID